MSLSRVTESPARPARVSMNPNAVTFMAWAAITFALVFPAVKSGLLDAMSTDDAMRLVEVRDFLAGQNWFDLYQHRLDPPGASMHWSRVIDLPLAAMISILRRFVGQQPAEAITLVVWPALLLGAALRLAASIASHLTKGREDSSVEAAAVLLAALSVPALVHFRGGAIDHHNAQIVLLLGLIAALLRFESSVLNACLAGFAAALSLAIGLEMLPAIAAACLAVLTVQVHRGGVPGRNAGYFGAAMCVSSILLAAGLLSPGSLTDSVCDAFGGPMLLLLAGGGMTLVLVAVADKCRPTIDARCAAAILAGGVVLGLFSLSFPGCLASPYAHVDPLVASFWLDHVFETMSFLTMLQHLPQDTLAIYGFPVLALAFVVILAARNQIRLQPRWLIAVLPLVALIATSLWEMRAAAAATMLAAPIVAANLDRFWSPRKAGQKLILVALGLSPATFAAISGPFSEVMFKPQWTIVGPAAASCASVSSILPLASLPEGRIIAPVDLGPEILVATRHSVYAAPYHRNNSGNLAMLNIMMAAPSIARGMLSDLGVDYVVLCRGGTDQLELMKLAPDGLAADLSRGQTPDFLTQLDVDPSGKLQVWRFQN